MSTKLIRRVFGMHRVQTRDEAAPSTTFKNDPYMRFPISVAGKVDAGTIWDGFLAAVSKLPAAVRDAVYQQASGYQYGGGSMTTNASGALVSDKRRSRDAVQAAQIGALHDRIANGEEITDADRKQLLEVLQSYYDHGMLGYKSTPTVPPGQMAKDAASKVTLNVNGRLKEVPHKVSDKTRERHALADRLAAMNKAAAAHWAPHIKALQGRAR